MITWKWMQGFLYQTVRMGKESKTAERQRERVCVRDSALLKVKDSDGHKMDIWWWTCAINEWVISDVVNDMLPTIHILSRNPKMTFRLMTSHKFVIELITTWEHLKYLFIYLFIHLFIYLFMYLFRKRWRSRSKKRFGDERKTTTRCRRHKTFFLRRRRLLLLP